MTSSREYSLSDGVQFLKAWARSEIRALSQSASVPAFKRIEILVEPVDILAWLRQQGLTPKIYWRGRDYGLEACALGCAYDAGSGLDDTRTAATCVADLQRLFSVEEEPLRFWGGAAFDPFKTSPEWSEFGRFRFILPRLELYSRDGRCYLVLNVSTRDDTPDDVVSTLGRLKVLAADALGPEEMLFSLVRRNNDPEKKDWTSAVREVQSLIHEGPLQKLVLARRTALVSSQPFDPYALLAVMRQNLSPTFLFGLQFGPDNVFLGASPERLYSRCGGRIHTEAVAGTSRRGETEDEDLLLQQQLRDSPKEQREHRIVVEMIRRVLKDLCVEMKSAPVPQLLRLHNGMHLVTLFEGALRAGVDDAALLSGLHPTPAVAGEPLEKALALIRELEPFSRGWFAGPVGYLSRAESEFSVAIRSAFCRRDSVSLFAGAGIVEGSESEREWDETAYKLESYLKVLDGNNSKNSFKQQHLGAAHR